MFVLAAVNIAAICQERANIPHRQKKNCFHCMTDVEFHLSILTGIGLQIQL